MSCSWTVLSVCPNDGLYIYSEDRNGTVVFVVVVVVAVVEFALPWDFDEVAIQDGRRNVDNPETEFEDHARYSGHPPVRISHLQFRQIYSNHTLTKYSTTNRHKPPNILRALSHLVEDVLCSDNSSKPYNSPPTQASPQHVPVSH